MDIPAYLAQAREANGGMTDMRTNHSALLSIALLSGMIVLTGKVLAAEEIKAPKPTEATAAQPDKPTSTPKSESSGWSAQVSADGSPGIMLSPPQTALVGKISKYFSDLTTLKGRFVQTGADKKVMKGKFKMMRPGMFRFDYARPSLQVIISDGRYLAIQDHDLGNEDRISLDQTPFRVLLRKNVDLIHDANIIEVLETDDTIFLALQDKNPDAPGIIKLTFTKTPHIELSQWTTTDAQGLDTHVEVKNLVHGEKLSAKEFVIKAPKQRFIR